MAGGRCGRRAGSVGYEDVRMTYHHLGKPDNVGHQTYRFLDHFSIKDRPGVEDAEPVKHRRDRVARADLIVDRVSASAPPCAACRYPSATVVNKRVQWPSDSSEMRTGRQPGNSNASGSRPSVGGSAATVTAGSAMAHVVTDAEGDRGRAPWITRRIRMGELSGS